MSKKRRKDPRRRRKVALPTDSTGKPIHLGDLLEWPTGERLLVETLSYVGEGSITWLAEEPGGDSDNLGASTIIRREVG